MSNEREKLLVVDDDETIRTMLTRFLERNGYAVAVAADGQQALAAVARESFDLSSSTR
jgi:DNA-binding response OmpR family regulator